VTVFVLGIWPCKKSYVYVPAEGTERVVPTLVTVNEIVAYPVSLTAPTVSAMTGVTVHPWNA
jgi:hypothetical protein